MPDVPTSKCDAYFRIKKSGTVWLNSFWGRNQIFRYNVQKLILPNLRISSRKGHTIYQTELLASEKMYQGVKSFATDLPW